MGDDRLDPEDLPWTKLSALSDHWTEASLWGRLERAMDASQRSSHDNLTVVTRRRRLGLMWSGIITAGFVLGLGSYWISQHATAPTYLTSAGQRETITLADGTRLTLGPESRLQLTRGYGHATRQVTLSGEVYFDVVHDNRRPFMVTVRGVNIRDVGTHFDVRAYDGDTAVRVAVSEGIVAIGQTDLHAGDVALTSGWSMSISHDQDPKLYMAWMQGGLVFQDTPLRDAVRDIGRTFGLKISIEDSTLVGKRITAQFARESADEILRLVTQVVGAEYERKGTAVVIRRSALSLHKRAMPRMTVPITLTQAASTS